MVGLGMALVLASGAWGNSPKPEGRLVRERDERLVREWIEGVRRDAAIALFTALPHPMFESERHAKERARNAHFEVAGGAFHSEAVPIDAAHIAVIEAAFTRPASFAPRPPGSSRPVGEFHADWALRWMVSPTAEGKTKHLWALFSLAPGEVLLCDDSQAWTVMRPLDVEALERLLPVEERWSADRDRARLESWIRARSRSEGIVVFQGLPRRFGDSAGFFAERARAVDFEVNGSVFYREPVKFDGAKTEALTQIVERTESFALRQPHVTKMCGGFHADWAVRWTRSGSPAAEPQYRWALICFGCGEVQLCDDTGFGVLVDFGPATRAALLGLFKDVKGPRPPSSDLKD